MLKELLTSTEHLKLKQLNKTLELLFYEIERAEELLHCVTNFKSARSRTRAL